MIKEKVTSIKTYQGKSDITSGNKYFITLKYNGNNVRFTFHDNIKNASDTDDFLYALLLDMHAYEDTCSYADFLTEFDYEEDNARTKQIYEACKKQAQRAHNLFTDEELKQLDKEFEDF